MTQPSPSLGRRRTGSGEVFAAWGTWARASLRGRLVGIVALAILAGATAGLAMAATDGARRSLTAIDRTHDATLQPDALALPSRLGFDWTGIEGLPEVDAIALFAITPICAVEVADPFELCAAPPADRKGGVDIDVLDVAVGRAPAPDAPDEVLVNGLAAERYDLELGSRLPVSGPTPDQWRLSFEEGIFPETFEGPVVEVEVVGIVERLPLVDRYLGTAEGVGEEPVLVTSPSFLEVYEFGYVTNAMIRLAPGSSVADLRAGIAEVTGDPTVPVRDVAQDRARLERSTQVEATALALFALAVTAAGLVLIGQAVHRLVQAGVPDAAALPPLGATPTQHRAALAVPGLVTAAIGSLVALLTAVALSPLFPIGLSRRIDLHSGIHLDAVVLVVGTFAAGALGVAVSWGAAVRATRARPAPATPSWVAAGIRALGLPLPVDLGSRAALVAGRGRAALPARPALVGAAVGVLGVVAAVTFQAGLDDAAEHPNLAGRTWDLLMYLPGGTPEQEEAAAGMVAGVSADPDVAGTATVTRAGIELGGETVSAWSFEPAEGRVERAVLSGRMPSSADEATLGASTARSLGVGVHDTVVASTVSGHTELTVVGIGLLPEQPGHSAYDQGLWVTRDALERIDPPEVDNRLAVIDLADGADPDDVMARFHEAELPVEAPLPISATSNILAVRSLPLVLAAFLVVLAIAALAHSLWSTVSRRRRDLAVLRAIGMTPAQVRVSVASQATAVGVVGLVAGIPLGVLVGRAAWRWVATALPLVYEAPLALVVVAVLVPAVLVVVNVVGLRPAHLAARQRPAEVLRTE